MRLLRLLTAGIFLSSGLLAQIPNAGMENWSGGEPAQWSTNNVPGIATPVRQTADARSGTAALELIVDSIFGVQLNGVASSTAGGSGFPVSQHYNFLTFYYKANFVGGDELSTNIIFTDFNGLITAAGGVSLNASTPVYTQVFASIAVQSQNPVLALINASITGNGGTGSFGTWARIDDFAFSATAGTNDLNAAGSTLSAPQPNPAAGVSLVPFMLRESGMADICVYDLNGRMVQQVIHTELAAGRYKAEVDAAALAAGVYTVRLTTGGQQQQVKLVVQ